MVPKRVSIQEPSLTSDPCVRRTACPQCALVCVSHLSWANSLEYETNSDLKLRLFVTELKTGIVSSANGSAFLELGSTKIVASVYGPRPLVRVSGVEGSQANAQLQGAGSHGATTSTGVISGSEFSDEAIVTCDWRYSTFADANEQHGDETERDLGMAVAQALEQAIVRKAYPKSSIDINILVLQDDGSCLSSAIICAGLALVHAGIQLYDIVSACSIALGPSQQLYVDPDRSEEKKLNGTMLFSMLMGTQQVNLLQHNGELSSEQMLQTVKMATQGCRYIHSLVKKHITESLNQ